MSDEVKLAWADEAPFILMYNALRAHDIANGTDLASFGASHLEMWKRDGIPYDMQDEAQRLALFRLLIWDAVKDRLGNDRN